ncbi:uncharacterized protein CC84DRAFT_1220165 [Paraphaeosphaeria sporulosa]|uniref:F-box domain-containing protein n=1 Tax=Paraphaeosphaeria sporulosa TaxID=1460663 RepID=A0A177C6M9_9PLEO|nr:uncharacterized protein CC84DRAFT_1220165 [Paraphaeosphaeria sporulosa]OAG03293.1 hypothetical protein CC84DRAFT_1220165 [Paraphaeosphaeria sporulosa]
MTSPPALLTLPTELLLHITSHITGPRRTSTLAALSLTCRRLHAIADGYLYTQIQIQIGKEDLLTRTLRQRKNVKDQVLDVGLGCAMTIWFGEEMGREVGGSAWAGVEVKRGRKRGERRIKDTCARGDGVVGDEEDAGGV